MGLRLAEGSASCPWDVQSSVSGESDGEAVEAGAAVDEWFAGEVDVVFVDSHGSFRLGDHLAAAGGWPLVPAMIW